MFSEKFNIWLLIILTISFLGYSFQLYVDPPAEKVQPGVSQTLSAEGKLLWQEKNCTACHQIYGLGGHLGPDLTNTYSLRPREYIEAFLRSGTDVMPDYGFSEEEINALISFLESIDHSGESDPRTFKKNLDGTLSK